MDIITECMQVEVDWAEHSLVEGGRAAQTAIAQRFPELGEEALEALFWAFTYNVR